MAARLPIASIDAGNRLRSLDPAWVNLLAEEIAADGLQEPIRVVERGEGYRLIAGARRLAAHIQLGRTEIEALVRPASSLVGDAELRLAEIKAEMLHGDLTVLERGRYLSAWRAVHEELHPQPKRGRKPAKDTTDALQELSAQCANIFTDAAKSALGLSQRSIYLLLKIASIDVDVATLIARHACANKRGELLLLAEQPVPIQAAIARMLTSDPTRAETVAEALAFLGAPSSPPEPAYARLSLAYHAKHIKVGSPAMPAAANDAPIETSPALTKRAALERDARLAIIAQFERFLKGSGLRLEQALQIFCDRWRLGRISVEDWVLDVVPRVSKGSLKRWLSRKRYGQTLGTDRGLARKGTGVLDTAEGGAVRAFVLGLIAHQPHLSADHVRDQVRYQFGDRLTVASKGVQKQVDVPPIRAFQRTIAALKASEKVVLTKLTNPDLFRSTMRLSGTGSMRHVTEPNAHWQIDASPVDALCTDGRHSVYVCIDIATRRLTLLLSRTPRAAAVALLVRKAILGWGVPGEIKTDNGTDFTARSTKRLLAHDLGIDLLTSDPFAPEQKGFVERAIKTFQHAAATLVPGFIGHNVTDRSAIESRKAFAQRLGEDDAQTFAADCTAAELQAHFDAWVELKYHQTSHDGLKGRTPFQAEASAAYTIRRVDERALDLLLAPIAEGDGTRVMTKKGFRVANYHYLTGSVMVGTRALVRHDPLDAGRIHLFGVEHDGYLGEAICAELAGIDPAAFAQAKREEQARVIREKTAEIEAVRRGLRHGPALIERAREVWLRDQPNVVVLPKPEVQHVTPSIAAAIEATAAPIAPPPARRAEPAEPARVTVLDTPRTRFRRALALEARIAAGDAIETADALWLGGYQQSSEYQAAKMVHEDLGATRR